MKNLTSPVVIKEINSDLTITSYGETSAPLKINLLDLAYPPETLEKLKRWSAVILSASHALEEIREVTLNTPSEDLLTDLLGQSVGSVTDALADVSSALYARVSDNDVSYSREESNG